MPRAKLPAPPPPTDGEIHRIVVLSTQHIPRKHIEAESGDLPTATYPTDVGALMFVTDAAHDRESGNDDDRRAAVRVVRRYARARGCAYILFDRDGPIVPGLPDHSATYG